MAGHKILTVESGSIAEEIGIEAGDFIVSINGNEIKDIFDYRYLLNDEELTILFEKADGEEWEIDIEKDEYDDLGLGFGKGLMDEYTSCRNKCVFCFIDQMPPGMRQTLYFKDDDARLSFLQGNYITLTNMSEEDFERVIKFKMSPINISVHTTNPELRCLMLHNRFAGNVMERIKALAEAGIEMNTQIVCCKGYNDGAELDRSIRELSEYLPYVKSLSVVPVGITKFRDDKKLAKLTKFTPEESMEVLVQIHKHQEELLKKHGTRFVFASDEWYIMADHPIPPASYYEGFNQIENGVGMVRDLYDDIVKALEDKEPTDASHTVSIATGTLVCPYIEKMAELVTDKFKEVKVQTFAIINNFFGSDITVAGLLTATDIIDQLKNKELGKYLLISDNLLKSGTDVLLDDLTVSDIEKALNITVRVVGSSGEDFVAAISEP